MDVFLLQFLFEQQNTSPSFEKLESLRHLTNPVLQSLQGPLNKNNRFSCSQQEMMFFSLINSYMSSHHFCGPKLIFFLLEFAVKIL